MHPITPASSSLLFLLLTQLSWLPRLPQSPLPPLLQQTPALTLPELPPSNLLHFPLTCSKLVSITSPIEVPLIQSSTLLMFASRSSPAERFPTRHVHPSCSTASFLHTTCTHAVHISDIFPLLRPDFPLLTNHQTLHQPTLCHPRPLSARLQDVVTSKILQKKSKST